MDGKVLADLCTKAGIPGKGSALASLEDDEVAKLKAYMEAAAAKKAGAPAAAVPEKGRIGAPIRSDIVAPSGAKKPPVIPTIRPRAVEPAPPPEPVEQPPVAEPTVAAEAPADETPDETPEIAAHA